jgi:hypothetical protein
MAMGRMDGPLAEATFAEGLELATAIGDDAVGVAIRHAQGVLAGCRGENALARELLEESLERLAVIDDDAGPCSGRCRSPRSSSRSGAAPTSSARSRRSSARWPRVEPMLSGC